MIIKTTRVVFIEDDIEYELLIEHRYKHCVLQKTGARFMGETICWKPRIIFGAINNYVVDAIQHIPELNERVAKFRSENQELFQGNI